MNIEVINNVEVHWWKDSKLERWNMKAIDLKTKKETSTWLNVESPHVSQAFQFMYKQCLEELKEL